MGDGVDIHWGQSVLWTPRTRAPCNDAAMSVPEAKSSKSLRFVLIIIVSLSVAFAVGLSLLIFYMVRPSGEKVGDTSLTDPAASLLVNGKQGDSLVFRVDA